MAGASARPMATGFPPMSSASKRDTLQRSAGVSFSTETREWIEHTGRSLDLGGRIAIEIRRILRPTTAMEYGLPPSARGRYESSTRGIGYQNVKRCLCRYDRACHNARRLRSFGAGSAARSTNQGAISNRPTWLRSKRS